MIQVGSKIRLKKNLSRREVDYYANFEIYPEQEYTIIRIDPDERRTYRYQTNTTYWADIDHIEDLYNTNLEKILE